MESVKARKFLGVKLPSSLSERVEKAVDEGQFINRSELVRVALREFFDNKEAN